MKPSQFASLVACIIAGITWVYLGQNFVLLSVFGDALTDGGLNPQNLVDSATSPSFQALWLTCLAFTLIWLLSTAKSRPSNSAEVRQMRPTWWVYAVVLVLLGWVYQLVFTVLVWQVRGIAPVEGLPNIKYYPVPPGGWLILLVLVVIDVCLLFWLPTMLASPKSYRFVVPGALKFLGGR